MGGEHEVNTSHDPVHGRGTNQTSSCSAFRESRGVQSNNCRPIQQHMDRLEHRLYFPRVASRLNFTI